MSKFTAIILGLVFCLSAPSEAQQPLTAVQGDLNGSVYTDYYIHVPSVDVPGDKGLILFLHGNGPSKDPITKSEGFLRVKVKDEGLPFVLENSTVFNQYADDYYILIPHHHASTLGDPEWIIPELFTLLENKINEWNSNLDDDFPSINPDKIVVVGFSLGGKGAWDFAEADDNEIAAGVFAGWGSALPNNQNGIDYCKNMANTPIWAINGAEDELFPIDAPTPETGRWGVNMIENAVFQCNPSAPFNKTILDGRNHYGWYELFNLQMGYDVYSWITSLDKSTTDYAPTVSVGDDKTISANSSQYIVYGFSQDILNEEITRTWNYEDVTGTLSTPLITSRFETDEYIILEGFEVDHQYRITLTVTENDGTHSVSDEMILTAVDPTGLPNATNFVYEIEGVQYPLTNEDVIDITEFERSTQELTTKAFNSFNVKATTDAFWVRSELNAVRLYNEKGTSVFDYQSRIFGSAGGPNLQLFETGTKRMTFTLDLYDPGSALSNYKISYQVSATFTDTPLPITLLSFTGKVEDDGVRLDWSTTEEEGNSHFEIYRGRSGDDLVKIAEVDKAPPGNLYNYYTFTDREATDGIYYYQLQSVDYDGHRDISDIIRVAITPGDEFVLYPNPAVNGQFRFTFSGDQQTRPELYNSRGQLVSFTLSPSPSGPGEQQLLIDQPTPGMYVLKVWHEGEQIIRKIMVE